MSTEYDYIYQASVLNIMVNTSGASCTDLAVEVW